jgi:hypothetical protein
MEQTREGVEAGIEAANLADSDFLFPCRIHVSPHVATRRYARVVCRWISSIGLDDAAYRTHTLHSTQSSLIYCTPKIMVTARQPDSPTARQPASRLHAWMRFHCIAQATRWNQTMIERGCRSSYCVQFPQLVQSPLHVVALLASGGVELLAENFHDDFRRQAGRQSAKLIKMNPATFGYFVTWASFGAVRDFAGEHVMVFLLAAKVKEVLG